MEHARVPADLFCVTIHADVRNVGMALLCVRVRYGTYVAGPKQKRLGAVQSEKELGEPHSSVLLNGKKKGAESESGIRVGCRPCHACATLCHTSQLFLVLL